jgi:serine/threonine-protein kinase RsbW
MPVRRFAAELKNLSAIRHFVGETALFLGADSDSAQDVVQAIDEAATNTILHGYAGKPGEIEICLDSRDNLLFLWLRDDAPLFDPTHVKPPDLTLPLEKRPLGGLGIFLIRQSLDDFRYRPLPGGGNELTFIKHMNRKEEI